MGRKNETSKLSFQVFPSPQRHWVTLFCSFNKLGRRLFLGLHFIWRVSMKTVGMQLAVLLSVALADSQVYADMPNIVWINAEDMSPHLGCYGHPDAITPNIDALANKGIVYRQAFATAPICAPSRSCLATGLYATSLGTQHLRCEIEIPQRVVPLATRLRHHGYYCTTSGKTDYNFDPSGIWDQRTNDPAPWRRRQSKEQPFFAFITVGETHEGPTNRQDRYERATRDLPAEFRHDPAEVTLPPFYPDTPEVRRIFAGMHDLASVFDRKVGELIQTLKDDGDFENTILFVFGDHGNGLPRYKRWLNDSGLRVPLVIYVPPKYRDSAIPREEMSQIEAGPLQTERLVSFVDFPPTALSLAGIPIPDLLQGQAFLGQSRAAPRKFVFGARSRADDMFEVSRSVSDGRYLYVRHFMPHLPYIQPSVIFDDTKSAFKELRRLHRADKLDEHASRLWAEHKPLEELYDLQSDPHELHNLADSAEHRSVKRTLNDELRTWILSHRDSGFMPESEYQLRSRRDRITPFDVIEDPQRFDLESALEMASSVGTAGDLNEWIAGLRHPESAVRYWAAAGMLAASELHSLDLSPATSNLVAALNDEAPCVAIAAAHTLLAMPELTPPESTTTQLALSRLMLDDRPWVALEACRVTSLLGVKARPLVPVMKQVVEANLADSGERRRYKDFNYASFTGWTLETSLRSCGEGDYVDSLYAEVIFEDKFAATSRGELKPNLVREPPPRGMGYRTNAPEGFLLSKWSVADIEPHGNRRAFWVIPKRADGRIESYAEQAGRSRNSICFANARVPEDAEHYVIEFRQWANDNDYIGFIVGASETVIKHDGVELGYARQLPGTDTTVRDIYYRSPWGRGMILNEAKRRQWVQHRIEVDGSHIAWSQDNRVLLAGTVKSLGRGGFFGIRQTYERGTRYDDVRIKVLKRSSPASLVRAKDGVHLPATVEDAIWNARDQKPDLSPGYDAFALLPSNRINLARLDWWQAPPKETSGELHFTVAVADNHERTVDISCAQHGRKLGEVKVSQAKAMQTFSFKLSASEVRQAISEGVRLGLNGGDSPLWIVLKNDSAGSADSFHGPRLVLQDEMASTP